MLLQERPRPVVPGLARARSVLAEPEVRWAAAATGLLAAGALARVAGAPTPVWWALLLACLACGGWEAGLAGVQALRRGSLDVDLLMVVAAVAAAAIGQVVDAALLVVIFATSGALEALATRRTEDSVTALLDLAPPRATRLRPDGGEEVVDAEDLAVGEVVLVRPGERVGADGVVVDGASDVDQASVTGEPLPVVRAVGDEVWAGTVNGTGALRVRVLRPAAESVVARIVAQVEQASATKARTQLTVERVEQRYSVTVVVATLALLAVPLALGAAFEPTLLRAITFMIVASPCAVVLATMPPLLAVIAAAGRRGVLLRSAVVVEQLAAVDAVALDKTGTLTEGRPRLAAVRLLPGAARGEDEVLALAAAAERPSEHPLAAAVVRAARERGLEVAAAHTFSATPGRGVRARVGGVAVHVASPATVPAGHPAAAVLDAAQAGGRTAVVVALDGDPVAVLELVDRTRDGAAGAVARLRDLVGADAVLLTGDAEPAARRLAAEVGLDDVRAGLLPEDKVAAVRGLQAAGRRVAVVGDGVNDAPALAAADVGVAMGVTGADVALETADVVVVRDELAAVPTVLALARRARRVVLANLVIAASVITVLVAWDLVGTLPLPLGVAGHEGSTVLVALNGLRLLRRRAWDRAAAQQGG